MALQLHLPDLSDGALALEPAGPAPPPRARLPWHQRLRDLVVTYLPLLLMGLLALGTWWLVKNTPSADQSRAEGVPREEPDYTMQNFSVERFDKNGHLKLRLQGERMRHFAATDFIEIDQVRMHAVGEDGRVTQATALRAVANGDGSEVQLIGDARVDSRGPRGEPIQFRGEFLHAFLNTERVRSHLPVRVTSNGSEFTAAGMDYDHLSGQLQLQGKMRAVLQPNARRPAAAASAGTR